MSQKFESLQKLYKRLSYCEERLDEFDKNEFKYYFECKIRMHPIQKDDPVTPLQIPHGEEKLILKMLKEHYQNEIFETKKEIERILENTNHE